MPNGKTAWWSDRKPHGTAQRVSLQTALDAILEGAPLTRTATLPGDTTMVDRVCWRLDAGRTVESISRELGISVDMVVLLAECGEPGLLAAPLVAA
jgi:hypothetical protein